MSTKLRIPKGFQPINTNHIIRVSSHGSGYYLRIPKEICDVMEIDKGDKIFVQLLGVKKGGSQ